MKMNKCPLCQILMRELCFNENDETLCKLYEAYEMEEIQGEKALNAVLKEAGYEAYQRAKNSLNEKGFIPDDLLD